MNKTLQILNYIICVILGVSVFAVWLPIDDGGYLGFYVMLFQLIIILYFHNALKDIRHYYIFTSLWLASNTINCLIFYFYTQQSITELDGISATGNPFDMFWLAMAPGLLWMIFYAVVAITVVLFIEFGISAMLRTRQNKKQTETTSF